MALPPAQRALRQLIAAKKPIKEVKKKLEKKLGKNGLKSSGKLKDASASARRKLKPMGSPR